MNALFIHKVLRGFMAGSSAHVEKYRDVFVILIEVSCWWVLDGTQITTQIYVWFFPVPQGSRSGRQV